MMQKKVCMLGAFAVGKTSLVSRFVKGMFSDRYQTTVGVKIDRKDVEVAGEQVRMLLWDVHGEDDFQKVRSSYLRGASGFILVVDGTRRDTLDVAVLLEKRGRDAAGDVPVIVLINKDDLEDDWNLDVETVRAAFGKKVPILTTSAMLGNNVDTAFKSLAIAMCKRGPSD